MNVVESTQPGHARLDEQVGELVTRIAELAREQQRDDLAARLRDEVDRDAGPAATVVVAGEAKRGKSSLVNALLGADFSPVDAAPATNAYVILRHGSSLRVRVFHDERPYGEDVTAHELDDWVTAAANPHNAKRVRSAEVELDHPLLARGLVLVDTPGVGGLDAAHADVTVAVLATADVLVFVLDASAPISDTELRFLARATERIGNLLIVLTKIDAYAAAEDIVEENRRLLAKTRFAPAPVFSVSSTRKRRADDLDGTSSELAQRLREMSGFVEFEEALVRHTAGRARILRLANVVQLARIVLEHLEESERVTIDGEEATPRYRDELQNARARIHELEEARRTGSGTLADEFATLQDELATDLDRGLLELEQRYQRSLDEKEVKLETLPERLDGDFTALVARLNASLAEGASRIVLAVAGTLAVEWLDTVEIGPGAVDAGTLVNLQLIRSRTAAEVMLDTTHALGGMYVPQRLLGGLTGLVFGGPVGAVIGVVAGFAMVGVNVVNRERVRSQRQAQALVAEAVRTARREVPPVFRARLRIARREVEGALYQAMKRREAELTAAIREHERLATEDTRTRNRAVAAAVKRCAALNRLSEEADELLQRLASAESATAA
jgi:GTP-binding protein EngB required for normal cell division